MRFSKLYYLAFTIAIIFNSCSKDTATLSEEEQELIAEEEQEQEAQEEEEEEEEEETVDTNLTARQAAQVLYEDYYEASRTEDSDVAWTGDEPSCNAGSVPQSTMDKMFTRIEYFRRAVGLNNTVSENETKSEKAQEAALMMKANGTLDHFPPDTWKCYTDSGSEGAGKSLLTQTRNAEAVDSYMRDAGASNGPVGHRRWLLYPRLQEIGIGNTNNTNAIWVIGDAGAIPADAPEFISWPPEGYAPKQLAYPRWSFSIAGADFTDATVTMNDQNNQTVGLSIEELNNSVTALLFGFLQLTSIA